MTAAPATSPPARRSPLLLAGGALGAVLCAVAVVHLGLGASGVGVGDLFDLALGRAGPEAEAVLLGSRLPRTLAGLGSGIALGVAGALIQGSTRNPLGAPDTLGVNAGAYLAVALAAYLGLDQGTLLSGGTAFLGGLIAAATVYLLTARGVLTPGRLLLAGACVTLAGMAGAEFLQILDQNATRGVFLWGNGTLLQTGLDRPLTIGAIILAAALLAPLLARPLDVLSLGDDTAQALGVRVLRTRILAWLVAVLLSAAAVTLTGPIGYVGLMAPVAVRILGVRQHMALLPLSALGGAVLVLAGDSAAQLALPPSAGHSELPVGVVTALVGGPVFVYLARRVQTGDADSGAAVAVREAARGTRYAATVAAGVVALATAMIVGLRIGDVHVSWGELLGSLTGSGSDGTDAVVFYRLPRILVAALAGACLAVAGTAIQSVVRNPLAEPGFLGITAGSSAGAVALITILPAAPAALIPVSAAVGGVLAMLLVLGIARSGGGLDPTRVVLVGLGVAVTAAALVNVMVVSAQMSISAALIWMAGSTYARDLTTLGWLVVPAVVGVLFALSGRSVDMLALGDDLPRALGLRLGRVRMLALLAGACLAAGAAAAVGTVGFVALVAPHLARRLVGTGTARLVPMAAVLGAVLVVAADGLGRTLLAPTEIPVGIMTAVIGTPYLVWLMRRSPTAG